MANLQPHDCRLVEINNTQKYEVADNNELDAISKKLIQQNMDACKKLAV